MKKSLYVLALILPLCVFANPTSSKIVSGDIKTIENKSSLTVMQGSDKAIINWDSFSIDKDEITKFIQPSHSSSVLNRVIGNNCSEIFGKLESNGKVLLINENGIFISKEGIIDTKGLFLSTLSVSNEDFLKGSDLSFSSNLDGKIINQGIIKTTSSDVVCIAKEVENRGKISSENSCYLYVGEEVLLKSLDDPIAVRINGEGSVTNSGMITALTTKIHSAGGNVYSLAINQEGVIDASNFIEENGKIILTANSGSVAISGEMKAPGGKVEITGDSLKLFDHAVIDVSSNTDAGNIYIGGGYQGKDSLIKNALSIYVDKDVSLHADSYTSGNGGEVIVWADGDTTFSGKVTARALGEKGDGGFVEISGKNKLDYLGNVVASSVNGKAGTLLLDPAITSIDQTLANTIAATLNGGTNYSGTSTDYIEFEDDVTLSWSTAQTLTLTADNFVSLGTHVTITSTNAGGNFDALVINGNGTSTDSYAYSGIIGYGTIISTVSGNVTFTGVGKGISTTSPYIRATGIYLEKYYTQYVGETGSIASTGAGNITLTGTGGSNSQSQEGVRLEAGFDITSSGAGDISLTGTGGSTLVYTNDGIYIHEDSHITASGTGDITLTGTATSNGRGVVTATTSGVGDASISVAHGSLIITGIGEGGGHYGILLDPVTITATNSATVSITGTAPPTEYDVYGVGIDSSTISLADGDLTIKGAVAATDVIDIGSSTITSTGGNVTCLGGYINFDDVDTTITDGNFTSTATGNVFSDTGISLSQGSITIQGGDINFTGGTVTPSSPASGIEFDSVIIQASNSGVTPSNVNITGVYNASTQGLIAPAVLLYDSSISLADASTLTITGTGTATTTQSGGSYGVWIKGNYDTSNDAIVNTGSGAVTITGTGVATDTQSNGVVFEVSASGSNPSISNTGSGTISITGNGTNMGVSANHFSLSTVDGNVSFTVPDIDTQGPGLYIYNASNISSSGSGDITLTGTGSTYGIKVDNSTLSTSDAGGISLTGTGLSDNSYGGVYVRNSANIASSGSGDITITGTGGPASESVYQSVYGVKIEKSTLSSSDSGTINLIGTGGSGGEENHGIVISKQTTLVSTGTGDIIITGTGGSNGTNCRGVVTEPSYEESSGAIYYPKIELTNADLSITGIGKGLDSFAVYLEHLLIIASNSSNVTIDGSFSAVPTTHYVSAITFWDSSISVVNGDITITGTTGGTATSLLKSSYGVILGGYVSSSYPTLRSTGSGSINITGIGPDTYSYGIELQGSVQYDGHTIRPAIITSSGTGNVNIVGYGSLYGLYLTADYTSQSPGTTGSDIGGATTGSIIIKSKGTIYVDSKSSIGGSVGTTYISPYSSTYNSIGIGDNLQTAPDSTVSVATMARFDPAYLTIGYYTTTVDCDIEVTDITFTSEEVIFRTYTGGAIALNGSPSSADLVTLQTNSMTGFLATNGTNNLYIRAADDSSDMGVASGAFAFQITAAQAATFGGYSDLIFGGEGSGNIDVGAVTFSSTINCVYFRETSTGRINVNEWPSVGPGSGLYFYADELAIVGSGALSAATGAYVDLLPYNPTLDMKVGTGATGAWYLDENDLGKLMSTKYDLIIVGRGNHYKGEIKFEEYPSYTKHFQFYAKSANISGALTSSEELDLTIGRFEAGTLTISADVNITDSTKQFSVTGETYGNTYDIETTTSSDIHLAGGVAGTGLSNTLYCPSDNDITCNISGKNAGTVTSGSSQIHFTQIDTIYGGGGANDNYFTVEIGAYVTGSLNGLGTGINKLTGPNENNTWKLRYNSVTEEYNDTGILNESSGAAITFNDIGYLLGNDQVDSFYFYDTSTGAPTVFLSGTLDGGGGTSNVLNYNNDTALIDIDLSNNSATNIYSDQANGFVNVNIVNNHTLYGPNSNNTWRILTGNSVSLNDVIHYDIYNLVGGTEEDVFYFKDSSSGGGELLGTINGTSLSGNTLDYSSYHYPISVDLSTGQAVLVGGYAVGYVSNIQNVVLSPNVNVIKGDSHDNIFTIPVRDSQGSIDGASSGASDNNTIIGPDEGNLWYLTGNSGDSGTTGYYLGNPNLPAVKVEFDNIQSFQGNTNNDKFIFSNTVTVAGTINGVSGNVTLDLSAYETAIALDFSTSPFKITDIAGTTDVVGGFSNIDIITGPSTLKASNKITSPNETVTWTILSPYDIDLTSNSIGTISCDYFGVLSAGTGADTFEFYSTADSLTSIDAGTGSNLLDYSNCPFNTQSVTINLNLAATQSGYVQGVTGTVTGVDNIIGGPGVNVLTGNSNDNTFTLSASTVYGSEVHGSAGTNTLTGPNVTTTTTTWRIGGSGVGQDAGYVDSVQPKAITFDDIQNLTGGTGKNKFKLIYNKDAGNRRISGDLNGGSSGDNTLDYSTYNTMAVDVRLDEGKATDINSDQEGSVSNIQKVIYGDGGGTYYGPDKSNIWHITGRDTGTIQSNSGTVYQLENIGAYVGGTSDDTFIFDNYLSQLTGTIDGTSLTGNTLNYSAILSRISIAVQLEDETATGTLGVSNIQNVIGNGGVNSISGKPGQTQTFTLSSATATGQVDGNGATSTTFVGPNANNNWYFDSADSGYIQLNGSTTIILTDIQSVTGGTGNDTFTINGGSLSGSLNGSTGTNAIVYDVTTQTDINFTLDTATSITGGFSNITSVQGSSNTSNKITGPAEDQTWTISGEDSGSVYGITFTNFPNLEGSSGSDTFVFTGSGYLTGSVDGTAAGTNSLTAADNTNVWSVTADNGGSLVSGSNTITFANIQNATGGSGSDTFNFTGDYNFSGTINGGSSSSNALNYTSRTSDLNIDLNNISNIQSIAGTSTVTMTLTGPDAANTWTITGENIGTVNDISFTDFQYIVGGTGSDTFEMKYTDSSNYGYLTGKLNGNSVSPYVNTLDYSDYFEGDVDVNLTTGTATHIYGGLATGISSIQKVIGGGTAYHLVGDGNDNIFTLPYDDQPGCTVNGMGGANTVIAPDNDNTWWDIDGDAGPFYVKETGTSGEVTLQNISNIQGGSGSDSFTFTDGGNVTGTINGGSSSGNSLNYAAYSDGTALNLDLNNISNIQTITGAAAPVNEDKTLIGSNTSNTWTINGTDSGTVNDITFTNFQNLTGGTGSDNFILSSGILTGTITGVGSDNTITGPDSDTTWTITTDAGTVASHTFTSIQNLQGGSGDDDFVFATGGSMSGTIDGGPGTNTLDYSAYVTDLNVSIALLNNIESIIGGQADNTLTGTNSNNTWRITGQNAGVVNDFTFTGFENLTGGTGNDTFIFSSNGLVSGVINGGASGTNTLNYGYISDDVTVNLLTGNATKTRKVKNIANIVSGRAVNYLTGSVTNDDTFTLSTSAVSGYIHAGGGNNYIQGPNADMSWTITERNGGTVGSLSFSGVKYLTGGTRNDNFTLQIERGVTEVISGGSSGNNSLTGYNVENTWTITANNAGTIIKSGETDGVTFSNIHNLTGGTSSDTFVLNDQMGVSGIIDGGSSSGNTLSYANYTTPVYVNEVTNTATNIGGYRNIQTFIGATIITFTIDTQRTDLTLSDLTFLNRNLIYGYSYPLMQNRLNYVLTMSRKRQLDSVMKGNIIFRRYPGTGFDYVSEYGIINKENNNY